MSSADDDMRARIGAAVRAAFACETERMTLLPGALGTRRFARVWLPASSRRPASLIARADAPEDPTRRPAGAAPEPALEPLRALLEREGLPVPRRYGDDATVGGGGVELLEDLGEVSLDRAAAGASAAELEALYREACALVPRLQRIEPVGGVEAFERRLDRDLFANKAERFARFSLGETGPSAAARGDVVRRAFAHIADEAAQAPGRLAHRDLQSTNLLRVDRGATPPALVMIDLQGAFLAPPEYDLVCLLRDSYVELPDAFVDARLAETRAQLPDAPDAGVFRHRFDLLTLTRKAKDHALFRYAADVLGDERYLPFQATNRRYLAAAAARVAPSHPALQELARVIDELPEMA